MISQSLFGVSQWSRAPIVSHPHLGVRYVPQKYPRLHEVAPPTCSPPPHPPHHLLLYEQLLPLLLMSHAHAAVSSSSSTNFQLVINNALDKYKKRTKHDLITHPLAAQIQSCNSPSAILVILRQQVQDLGQSQSSDERWSKWLDPTVNVIYVLSSTLAAGVSLVCISRHESV